MNQNENQQTKLHFEISPETNTLSYESTRKYFTIIGFAFFVSSLVTMLTQYLSAVMVNIIASTVAPFLLSTVESVSIIGHLCSFIPIYCIGLPIFLKITQKLPKIKPLKQKMKFHHILAGLCICVALMISGNIASNNIMAFLEGLKGEAIENPVRTITSNSTFLINFVFVAIAAPILEEIFHRKIVCSRLLPLGEGWAVVISAAAFSLAHENLYQALYAFTLGLFFGFIYVKTGKLIYSIFYHFAVNFLGGVITPFLINQIDKISPDLYNRLLTETDMSWFMEMAPEQQAMFTIVYTLLTLHSLVLYGLAIVGGIILIVAAAKRKFTFESGLIPPVEKGKFSAFFLNAGVAASIAYFAFRFIYSLV